MTNKKTLVSALVMAILLLVILNNGHSLFTIVLYVPLFFIFSLIFVYELFFIYEYIMLKREEHKNEK